MKIVTLSKIQHFLQNFMPYGLQGEIICILLLLFLNFRFSPFCEHFHQLHEKYTMKWQTKHIILIPLAHL